MFTIYNPLPKALSHYARALEVHLRDSGLRVVQRTENFEVGTRSFIDRVVLACRLLPGVARIARTNGELIITWPIFGLFDVALWRILSFGKGARYLVIHDPVPLRKQIGYSDFAFRLAALCSRSGSTYLVTHTNLAARVLRERGVSVTFVLPHPIAARSVVESSRNVPGSSFLVAGQYKAARDLTTMQGIAAQDSAWRLEVVGRGWPQMAGWSVDDRFVEEDELERRLLECTVLAIPYDYYFQSGIAVRCFELGVPIVARRHEFLESLYGPNWPGYVDGETAQDWLRAAERVAGTTPPSAANVRGIIARRWATALGDAEPAQ